MLLGQLAVHGHDWTLQHNMSIAKVRHDLVDAEQPGNEWDANGEENVQPSR